MAKNPNFKAPHDSQPPIGRRRQAYLSETYGHDFMICDGDYEFPNAGTGWLSVARRNVVQSVLYALLRWPMHSPAAFWGDHRDYIKMGSKARKQWIAVNEFMFGAGGGGVKSRVHLNDPFSAEGTLRFCTQG